MNWQQNLFECNRGRSPFHDRIFREESAWVTCLTSSAASPAGAIAQFAEFKRELRQTLEGDAVWSEDESYLAESSTREVLAAVIGQYAVDGLTEAQAMFYVVARLPPKVQMPVMRVLIDEFGCGNLQASHSELYRKLLRKLGLPDQVEAYLDGTLAELFDFVDIYHWMTRRVPVVDYYMGALAYTEAAVPQAFRVFERACTRLGVTAKAYFTEHIHIDEYHARDALVALRVLDTEQGVDFCKAWVGVEMVRSIGRAAFRAAVAAARNGAMAWKKN